jgi:4-hydroxybenzoate polyprenyltransferase
MMNSEQLVTSSAKTSVTLVDTLLSKLVLQPSLVCPCARFDFRMLTGLGANHAMDYVSVTAVIISGMLIFTTIQAQDFPDVEGDKALGRMTFPIYAPEFSRLFTLVATIVWSMFLSWFWEVGPISTAFLVCFGAYIGMRYYLWRSLEADKKSYLIFNVRP